MVARRNPEEPAHVWKRMRHAWALLWAPLLLATGLPAGDLPPDTAVRKMLAERFGAGEKNVGVAVGLIGPQGVRVVRHGDLDGDRPVFEIGSVTKVFTALLLADMAGRGEVSLSDPVAKHLPSGFKVPARSGAIDYAPGPGHSHLGAAVHAGRGRSAL